MMVIKQLTNKTCPWSLVTFYSIYGCVTDNVETIEIPAGVYVKITKNLSITQCLSGDVKSFNYLI